MLTSPTIATAPEEAINTKPKKKCDKIKEVLLFSNIIFRPFFLISNYISFSLSVDHITSSLNWQPSHFLYVLFTMWDALGGSCNYILIKNAIYHIQQFSTQHNIQHTRYRCIIFSLDPPLPLCAFYYLLWFFFWDTYDHMLLWSTAECLRPFIAEGVFVFVFCFYFFEIYRGEKTQLCEKKQWII